jgi:hypothetical protein
MTAIVVLTFNFISVGFPSTQATGVAISSFETRIAKNCVCHCILYFLSRKYPRPPTPVILKISPLAYSRILYSKPIAAKQQGCLSLVRSGTKPSVSGFGGLGFSMLASGTQVPEETVGFFRAKKSSACLSSEGK